MSNNLKDWACPPKPSRLDAFVQVEDEDSGSPHRSNATQRRRRKAFTLVELLMVIAVIVVLSSIVVVALRDARESAKQGRAETQVMRIGEMIMTRWEEYESRQIPLPPQAGITAQQAQFLKYRYTLDMMRMEMPDRITDVMAAPIDPGMSSPNSPIPLGFAPALTPPALWQRYNRIVAQKGGFNAWSPTNQGAECLFMILQTTETVFGDGTDFLAPTEIGDTDEDGFPEVLDPWGNPIHFIRWAPGFDSPIQTHPIAGPPSPAPSDNPIDPFQTDIRWAGYDGSMDSEQLPFALTPVVVSSGSDGELGLVTDFEDPAFVTGRFSYAEVELDPYFYYTDSSGNYRLDYPWAIPQSGNVGIQMGWKAKYSASEVQPFADNIDNHHGINQ